MMLDTLGACWPVVEAMAKQPCFHGDFPCGPGIVSSKWCPPCVAQRLVKERG